MRTSLVSVYCSPNQELSAMSALEYLGYPPIASAWFKSG